MADTQLYRAGVIEYAAAWAWQKEQVQRRYTGSVEDVLFLLQHPPTYTYGRATQPEHLPDRVLLEALGARVFEVERGGSITYHGPGQLVGYAIVDLRARDRDVHRYLRDLEEVLIGALADLGLAGERRPGLTGVWVGQEKVAAIGIHVSRWISSHGFALNVDLDLGYFRAVRPCGLRAEQVTSLAALLARAVDMVEVENALCCHFAEVFGAQLIESSFDGVRV